MNLDDIVLIGINQSQEKQMLRDLTVKSKVETHRSGEQNGGGHE